VGPARVLAGANEFYFLTTTGRTLQLRAADEEEREAWMKTLSAKTSLVEFVVHRATRVVHMFNVVEHGRRMHRQLVFSSDWHRTLHEMPALHPPDNNGIYTRHASAARFEPNDPQAGAAGRRPFQLPVLPRESLIISRNLGCPARPPSVGPAALAPSPPPARRSARFDAACEGGGVADCVGVWAQLVARRQAGAGARAAAPRAPPRCPRQRLRLLAGARLPAPPEAGPQRSLPTRS